jgi:predicted KAP-like P-loop ATPase
MQGRGWRFWRRGDLSDEAEREARTADVPGEEPDSSTSGRSPDSPIRARTDDRLRRAEFARAVAEDVRHAPRGDGFVIAITGEWGEGKTSVINLLTAELDDEVNVVHFNPWLFSGTEQLVEHFFEELAAQLRETGQERLKRVANAFDAYGRVVAPLTVLPWIGELVRSSREIASTVSGALESGQPSARQAASELRNRLNEVERRVLVVVDDLDRLSSEEITDVMRLVRLVGDFPNLVYLLAFDRDRVEQALGGQDRERGRIYLEKIVQVIHRLPELEASDLYALLFEQIDATVGELEHFHFSEEHFRNLFVAGMRDLFSTVRDVHRYTNVLPATLTLIGDEVELADVLALEAIRVFLPDGFDRLAEARRDLTATRDLGPEHRATQEAREARVRAIIGASGPHSAQMQAMITRLFPAADHFFGGSHYGSDWLSTWRRERRVAHPEVLDIYLRRRVAEGDVAARDVAAIFSALEDDERLEELLAALEPDELERVLVRLQHYEDDYPGTNPHITISVLLSQARRLSSEPRGMSLSAPDMELSRVVYRLLRNLDPTRVEEVVREIQFPDLSSRYDVVRMIGHREGSGHRLVPEAVAQQFESQLLDAVLGASAEDMASEKDLGPLIGLGVTERTRETHDRVIQWIESDHFLIQLLGANLVVSRGHTVGEAAVFRNVVLNWPSLAKLIGQDVAAERVKQLDADLFIDKFGDDAGLVREQALTFADDPAAGERAMARFRTDDDPPGDEQV